MPKKFNKEEVENIGDSGENVEDSVIVGEDDSLPGEDSDEEELEDFEGD